MNEFELIAELTRDVPTRPDVQVGPGDDCAVLTLPARTKVQLFKTDAVVEDVHFVRGVDPAQLGHKALARCLSDIAAMGGVPTSAVITLGLPTQYDESFVREIYQGLFALARKYEVAVVGGETVRSPEKYFISIALLGEVEADQVVLRKGARTGDALFVTGELGGSRRGHHLTFEPRLAEGAWLAREFHPSSMIDLSDGLAGDLKHILRQSGVGAELLTSAIPVSRAARMAAREDANAKPPLLAALTDGEDFELLFSIASFKAVPLLDAWKARFPDVRLSCIGKLVAGSGIRLCDANGIREFNETGFQHFSEG